MEGLAILSGRVGGLADFSDRWFATRPHPFSGPADSWSGDVYRIAGSLSIYAYVDGQPTRLSDALGLAPGDKSFGISDKGFWTWWHQEKNRGGAWWGSDEPGFNPKKPNDIPNQRCADILKAEYDHQKSLGNTNAKDMTRAARRGRGGGGRGGGFGGDGGGT